MIESEARRIAKAIVDRILLARGRRASRIELFDGEGAGGVRGRAPAMGARGCGCRRADEPFERLERFDGGERMKREKPCAACTPPLPKGVSKVRPVIWQRHGKMAFARYIEAWPTLGQWGYDRTVLCEHATNSPGIPDGSKGADTDDQ